MAAGETGPGGVRQVFDDVRTRSVEAAFQEIAEHGEGADGGEDDEADAPVIALNSQAGPMGVDVSCGRRRKVNAAMSNAWVSCSNTSSASWAKPSRPSAMMPRTAIEPISRRDVSESEAGRLTQARLL